MDFGHRTFARILGLIAAMLLGVGGATSLAACPVMTPVTSSSVPCSGGKQQMPVKSCTQICGMACEALVPTRAFGELADMDRLPASPPTKSGLIPVTTAGPEPPPPRT